MISLKKYAEKTMDLDKDLLLQCGFLLFVVYGSLLVLLELSFLTAVISSLICCSIYIFCKLRSVVHVTEDKALGKNPRDHLRQLGDITEIRKKPDACFFEIYTIRSYLVKSNNSKSNNSLTALRKCAEKGCKFVYLDVRLTADNVPVVLSKDSVVGQREVEIMAWDDVKYLNVCAKHPLSEFGEEEKISSLESVLNLCSELDLRVIINLNHFLYYKQTIEMTTAIIKFFEESPDLYERVVITSTNLLLIYLFAQQNPEVTTTLILSSISDRLPSCIPWLNNDSNFTQLEKALIRKYDAVHYWFFIHFLYRFLGIKALILHKDMINPNLIQEWEEKNIRVIASNVNLAIEKAYFSEVVGVTYLSDTLNTGKVIIEDWFCNSKI